MESLQIYWWLLISLLAAVLVFLLFVQGGQTMILCQRDEEAKKLMVNSLGRKWELTFTSLTVFGGAFFAAFPLFYSTSFGGAYWLWMLILLSFILQAVSYEFRRKEGNLFGTKTYDIFLFFNGCAGCILLGVAVGTMFFGGDFTISRGNIVAGEAPFVSTWGEGHGIEAILNWKCLLLGLTLLMLARTNAALYFLNNINKGEEFSKRQRISALNNGAVFVVLFLALAVVVLSADGYALNQSGQFEAVAYKYADNLITLWWLGLGLLIGVAAVLYGLVKTLVKSGYRYGIWWTGAGTVLVILTLLCALGYNGTAYLPSTTSPESSLTIANSSSSEFTLTVMSWVSIISPFVIAYIYVVWRKLSSPALTAKEVDEDSHSY
jgi:cytochrome d ubiquinol oxidase subunit II